MISTVSESKVPLSLERALDETSRTTSETLSTYDESSGIYKDIRKSGFVIGITYFLTRFFFILRTNITQSIYPEE